MFTGIIEATGTITTIETEGQNVHFWVRSSLTPELQIDQSVAHNGVCLTVVDLNNDLYKVTAIDETLQKTNLSDLKPGDEVNLERSMPSHGRFDGHIVQGHVDQVAICEQVTSQEGSFVFTFKVPGGTKLMVEKGSICINGISLTSFNVTNTGFKVAIIPYTYEHTNISHITKGSRVNLEFDILGKYVQKMMQQRM